jgi:hypothetical protein
MTCGGIEPLTEKNSNFGIVSVGVLSHTGGPCFFGVGGWGLAANGSLPDRNHVAAMYRLPSTSVLLRWGERELVRKRYSG